MKPLTRPSTRWSSTGGGGGEEEGSGRSHSGISKGAAMRLSYARSYPNTYYGQWLLLFPWNAQPERGGQCPSSLTRPHVIPRLLWIRRAARRRVGHWPGVRGLILRAEFRGQCP